MVNAICEQIDDLVCRIRNTCLLLAFGLSPKRSTIALNLSGRLVPDHRQDSLYLICICYRHDSRNNRNGNTLFSRSIEEIIKNIVIKKHLCSQEIYTTVYFLFQMCNIILLMFGLYMSFRITCSPDAEISLTLDILDQLICILIMIRKWEFTLLWNISSESKDILNSAAFN